MPLDVDPVSPAPAAPAGADGLLPDALHRAFGALSPAHRLLVLLCDINSMSYQEAAAVLGCPLGSVMSGLHNARKRLRSMLVERGQGAPGKA